MFAVHWNGVAMFLCMRLGRSRTIQGDGGVVRGMAQAGKGFEGNRQPPVSRSVSAHSPAATPLTRISDLRRMPAAATTVLLLLPHPPDNDARVCPVRLAWEDIAISDDNRVLLKRLKTDQFTEVFIGATGNDLCPVDAV